MPGCWVSLLQRLRERDGEVNGSKDFIEALQMCCTYGEEAMTSAVERALRHPEVALGTIRYHLWSSREKKAPEPAALAVGGPRVTACSAAAYMSLCGGEELSHE